MTVASDAGPLIALARIGRTDILTSLFREVHIPPAVLREITDDARSNRTGAAEFASASWLIRDRLVRSSGEYLQDRLGAGESEAIILVLGRHKFPRNSGLWTMDHGQWTCGN